MNVHDILISIGIDPTVLYAGGFGGILRALTRKHLKVREMVISPICGALAAAYLTLPVVHYVREVVWSPPDDAQAILAAAFILGTCAMWITDFIGEMIVRWFRPKSEAS